MLHSIALGFALFAVLPGSTTHDADASSWRRGRADLHSAGVLAFAPGGVLLVADPASAALFALETGDVAGDPALVQLSVERLDEQLAALLGARPADLTVNDLAVNPDSGNAYLSVTRGQGEAARPALVRVDGEGELSLLDLDDIRFAKAVLANAPAEGGARNQRLESITDLAFVDGRVVVAGLSNEEFASKLRAVPYPFSTVAPGTSVEIYHGAHGAFETRAPVRTLVPFSIEGEPHLLAAYTCTPLVKFPLSVLDAGNDIKVRGTTVAELGGGNRPLDMIAYRKGGQDFLLVANSHHGLLKVSTAELAASEGITTPVARTAGLGFEPVEYLEGVVELDRLDDDYVVVLVRTADSRSGMLLTVETP